MSPILRTVFTIAATLMLAGCDDPTRVLAPSAPRSSLGDGSSAGSTIAFRSIEARCGWEMMAGCDGDEENGWGWTTWSGLATIDADGTSLVNVTYMVEDNTLSRLVMPAWSPDGMRIAFQDGSAIMVVAGAGGTPLNLTRYPSNDGHATWSPDGSRIAFSSDRGGTAELYVMNAPDGSNVTRLTNAVGFTGHPDWSADGARILFDCVVEAGNGDVCAVNADGTDFTRLTSAPGYDGSADWSPAGTIAFVTRRFGAGEIVAMNGDGSGVTRLGAGIAGEDPAWSPDAAGSRSPRTSTSTRWRPTARTRCWSREAAVRPGARPTRHSHPFSFPSHESPHSAASSSTAPSTESAPPTTWEPASYPTYGRRAQSSVSRTHRPGSRAFRKQVPTPWRSPSPPSGQESPRPSPSR